MEIEQRIYNGDRAREVLENEAFQQAMTELKSEVIAKWQSSPARDPSGRETLWQLLKIAEKFETILTSSLETGKLAQMDLAHKESLLQKAKRTIGLA